MTHSLSFRSLILFLCAGIFVCSCTDETIEGQNEQQSAKMLPSIIDYKEYVGSLSHLTYRSTFEYNEANQLVSVRDSLLAPPMSSSPYLPWVNFYYHAGKLTKIILRPVESYTAEQDYVYQAESDPYAANFELEYSADQVNTRLVINGQKKQDFSFKQDENGFPIKKDIRYGRTFLNSAGNIDLLAESKAIKQYTPDGYYEVVDYQFDTNKNVFADSKEFQVLAVLLEGYEWNLSTSLVPFLQALTTNNVIGRATRYCAYINGCGQPSTDKSETLSVNEKGFPTRRVMRVGAMGQYEYIIQYKK